MLSPDALPRFQAALGAAGLDGWLLYDFRGINPIAGAMLGLEGMLSRRIFVWIPRAGAPTAVTHAIEPRPWATWPKEWGHVVYSAWRDLEGALAPLVRGKRIAMEYSPGDAVPVLDRVPGGVLDLVRQAGATVLSSGDLVTQFYALWDAAQLASHCRAAEGIAAIARDAMALAARSAATSPLTEYALQRWIRDRFARAGLETDHGPNVSVGPNAADPHYEPVEGGPRTLPIAPGVVLLIDLWAREPHGIYADQTWVATLGTPDARTIEVWNAVRDARDAAIGVLRERVRARLPVRGAELDDAARGVIVARGFGAHFPHRTGHSIDSRDLHGSGPNIDDLETRDDRALIPGVGFSIEPGIYLAGSFGMRSEVNAFVGDGEVTITPTEYQQDLTVL
jgi:Xaa-Pro aminopeptidase